MIRKVGVDGHFEVHVPLGVYVLKASNGCTSNSLRIHTSTSQSVEAVFLCPAATTTTT